MAMPSYTKIEAKEPEKITQALYTQLKTVWNNSRENPAGAQAYFLVTLGNDKGKQPQQSVLRVDMSGVPQIWYRDLLIRHAPDYITSAVTTFMRDSGYPNLSLTSYFHDAFVKEREAMLLATQRHGAAEYAPLPENPLQEAFERLAKEKTAAPVLEANKPGAVPVKRSVLSALSFFKPKPAVVKEERAPQKTQKPPAVK